MGETHLQEAIPDGAAAARYQPYPKYKESGVEWLGVVPRHWEVKRLKSLAKLMTGGTPVKSDPDNYSSDGLLWIKPDNLDDVVRK